MRYTKEQRLDIGRQIYDGELSRYQAAEKYEINDQTARNYMRLYRDTNNLPPKQNKHTTGHTTSTVKTSTEAPDFESYKAMTKDELIQELIKSRINEARLKKNYEVKGDGTVIRYTSKNTR